MHNKISTFSTPENKKIWIRNQEILINKRKSLRSEACNKVKMKEKDISKYAIIKQEQVLKRLSNWRSIEPKSKNINRKL